MSGHQASTTVPPMSDVDPRPSALAVVPVRGAALPAGGAEVVAEADGRALLVGDGAGDAAAELTGLCTTVEVWDTPGFAPGEWAQRLATRLAGEHRVLLPASPDGRDLAPRLAAVLDVALFAGAMELDADSVTTIRHGGRVLARQPLTGPAVITFQPGVRTVVHGDTPPPQVVPVQVDDPAVGATAGEERRDATVLEVLAPDVSTMDLSEAPRILGGGAGLGSAEQFSLLARVAESLGASMGATRVITDRGWISHDRQIGTTGVVVDPRLYLAFGISGAVQHTAGLGHPEHVISINTDQHCPMMELADLAVVADANATLDELADRLGVR